MPLLGAHMSGAGGLHLAFARIKRIKGQALQLFTRNQRQWFAAPVGEEEAAAFQKARQEWGDFPVASHASYLINLASPKEKVAAKSVQALTDELLRCEMLNIPSVVMHPGAHLGTGIEKGLRRFVRNLDRAFARAEAARKVLILVETTAGQGSGLGSRFEELAFILEKSSVSDRLGVCLDTCHCFAAGYDIRTPETYEATLAEFSRLIGFERLKFFHLNDSIQGLGSRVDRHTHIGKGEIGLAGFKLLLNDRRFGGRPMVLETPKGKDDKADIENLGVLRGLLEK